MQFVGRNQKETWNRSLARLEILVAGASRVFLRRSVSIWATSKSIGATPAGKASEDCRAKSSRYKRTGSPKLAPHSLRQRRVSDR